MQTAIRALATGEPFTIELTIEDLLADLDPGFLPVPDGDAETETEAVR